jgi:hypothetical protein
MGSKNISTNPSCKLEINRNKLRTVKNFKYLGEVLKDNGSSNDEIEKRISETSFSMSN